MTNPRKTAEKDKEYEERRRLNACLAKEGRPRPKIDFSKSKDLARQEYKQETDINYIVQRTAPQPMLHERGITRDMSAGLKDALDLQVAMRTHWDDIPRQIRKRYHNWNELLGGIYKKEIVMKDGKLALDIKPPTPHIEVQPPTPEAKDKPPEEKPK